MSQNRTALLLLLPAALLMGGLALYPLARSLALSFFVTEYGFEDARFVGLLNYERLFSDRFFLRAIRNTVSFTLLATLGELALGLGLALLVNRGFWGRKAVIPVLVAPFILSTMVVTAIWAAWFHYDFGYLNNLVRSIGLDGVEWLSDPKIALLSLVLVDVWQTTPLVFLILLAGLQSIDPALYEAARLDGARSGRMLWTITLPLLLPHLMLAALLRSIDSFKIFDKVYALTGGGPGQATETLSMFLFRQGFRFQEMGAASATAMIMVAIAAVLAGLYAIMILRRKDTA